MKTLVTGAASGIGKYLVREFNADSFTRANTLEDIRNNGYDLIIHCATNHCHNITSQNISDVYEDNLFLTHGLASIANAKAIFVYFSSIEVYPSKNNYIFDEEEIIPVDRSINLYGLTKLMGEQIVSRTCEKHVIIRPGLLIGEFMRPNSLSKVIDWRSRPNKISLSHDSEFYIVSYEEVLNFIRITLERAAWGTYNLFHPEVITLGEVAKIFETKPEWGDFRYSRPRISNLKSTSILPSLASASYESLLRWFK